MPQTEHFKVEILVDDYPIPEYERDGNVYVESNLNVSEISYHVRQHDLINGEQESQRWPVTPYKVRITPKRGAPKRYFDVFVDGIKVKSCSVGGEGPRVISGFKDKNCVREFLFSLPRFAYDEDDRLVTGRETRVGTVEVECYDAMLLSTKVKSRKSLNYEQANKKDCTRVTKGEFTMSTTKVGNVLYRKYPHRSVHVWRRLDFLSKVTIHYRMCHSLMEMGFRLKPYFGLDASDEISPSEEDGNMPSTSNGRRRRKTKSGRGKKSRYENSDENPIILGDSDTDEEYVTIKEGKQRKPVLVDLTEDDDTDMTESNELNNNNRSEMGNCGRSSDLSDVCVKTECDSSLEDEPPRGCSPRGGMESGEKFTTRIRRTSSDDSPFLKLSHNSHENSPVAQHLLPMAGSSFDDSTSVSTSN